jgi:hypothetical protein
VCWNVSYLLLKQLILDVSAYTISCCLLNFTSLHRPGSKHVQTSIAGTSAASQIADLYQGFQGINLQFLSNLFSSPESLVTVATMPYLQVPTVGIHKTVCTPVCSIVVGSYNPRLRFASYQSSQAYRHECFAFPVVSCCMSHANGICPSCCSSTGKGATSRTVYSEFYVLQALV